MEIKICVDYKNNIKYLLKDVPYKLPKCLERNIS